MDERRSNAPSMAPGHDETRPLTAAYVGALVLIAGLVLGAHGLMTQIIDAQMSSATIVNLAGRQRMLSQRILRLALSADEPAELDAAMEQMASVQRALSSGSESLGIPAPSHSWEMVALHGRRGSDRRVAELLEQAQRFAPGAGREEALVHASDAALESLESTVSAFEYTSRRRVGFLSASQDVLLAAVLLTLLFEGVFVFRPVVRRVHRYASELRRLANVDALTGLSNRRAFLACAEAEHARAKEEGAPLAVLMLDVDHFKSVNDSYGHAGGDAALRALGNTLRQLLRGSDVAGRIGGEEFAALLPDTSADGAAAVAERIRRTVERMNIAHPVPFRISISIGVCILGPKEAIDSALGRADGALYEAKEAGRNRVVVAETLRLAETG